MTNNPVMVNGHFVPQEEFFHDATPEEVEREWTEYELSELAKATAAARKFREGLTRRARFLTKYGA